MLVNVGFNPAMTGINVQLYIQLFHSRSVYIQCTYYPSLLVKSHRLAITPAFNWSNSNAAKNSRDTK